MLIDLAYKPLGAQKIKNILIICQLLGTRVMHFFSIFPYSACGICQSFFSNLLVAKELKGQFTCVETAYASIFVIPSLINVSDWPLLKQKISQLKFPRKIIAIGDIHHDLGIKIIYLPERLPVEIIPGCPPTLDSFIKLLR